MKILFFNLISMKLKSTLCWLVPLVIFNSACSIDKLYQMKQNRKVNPYEQINFNKIVKLYMAKDKTSVGTIEGIYAVSSLVTKKGKGMLSSSEKEKITDRKENYSEVAIIQDKNTSGREYLEVPLDKDYVPSYSVRGEFTGMSEGNILVYKHFESRRCCRRWSDSPQHLFRMGDSGSAHGLPWPGWLPDGQRVPWAKEGLSRQRVGSDNVRTSRTGEVKNSLKPDTGSRSGRRFKLSG